MSARTRVAMPQKTPTLIASLYDTVLVGLPPEDFFFGVFVGAMPPVYRHELRAGPYGARGHNRRRGAATPSPRLTQAALKPPKSARPLVTRAGSDSPARSIGWTTGSEQAKMNVCPPPLDTPPGRRRAHFASARPPSLAVKTAPAPPPSLAVKTAPSPPPASLQRGLMPTSRALTPPTAPHRPAPSCAASRPCCSSP